MSALTPARALSPEAELGELVTRPVTIVALVLLALNDHVLKALWPGAVTGKLSDLAGLVVLPCLVVASVELLTGRVVSSRVAVVVTLVIGVSFALAKTSAPIAEWYRSSWGWLAHPLDALRALAGWLGLDGAANGQPSHRVLFARDVTDLLALPALFIPLYLAAHRRGLSSECR